MIDTGYQRKTKNSACMNALHAWVINKECVHSCVPVMHNSSKCSPLTFTAFQLVGNLICRPQMI